MWKVKNKYNINENVPVVKIGVHSCSPVAPHSSVQLFVELLGGSLVLDVV